MRKQKAIAASKTACSRFALPGMMRAAVWLLCLQHGLTVRLGAAPAADSFLLQLETPSVFAAGYYHEVRGWAAASFAIQRLEARLVSGTNVYTPEWQASRDTQLTYGLERQDACPAAAGWPNCPYTGFSGWLEFPRLEFDILDLSTTVKGTLQFRAVGFNGETMLYPANPIELILRAGLATPEIERIEPALLHRSKIPLDGVTFTVHGRNLAGSMLWVLFEGMRYCCSAPTFPEIDFWAVDVTPDGSRATIQVRAQFFDDQHLVSGYRQGDTWRLPVTVEFHEGGHYYLQGAGSSELQVVDDAGTNETRCYIPLLLRE